MVLVWMYKSNSIVIIIKMIENYMGREPIIIASKSIMHTL